MKNINVEVKGGKLILTVDLKERHGLSSSWKTVAIASTEGNQKVPGADGVSFGLSVYTKEGLDKLIKEAQARGELPKGK